MLIRRPADIPPSEITAESIYARRREFVKGMSVSFAAGALGLAGCEAEAVARGEKLPFSLRSPHSTNEPQSSYETITTYGNFYEFGPNKDDPGRSAPKLLKPRPWTVSIDGEVSRPRTFGIDDILKMVPLEERIYRLRCVEGWSMVIPWTGLPLAELVKRCEPTGNARFVEFTTLADPQQMPYVRSPLLDWPYLEALRLDEAMNPLAILAVGLYGEVLPNQNGAPLRLVVPWKYGFKSGKSIVRIRFVAKQPETTWMKSGRNEYGFYSNVNPEVDHPRWSQGSERRLGEFAKRKTLMFNGYGEQVASMYAGMDLRKYF